MPDTELPPAGAAWMELWRTIWLDLPLVWADEMERFLFGRVPPDAADADPPADRPF